MQVLAGVRILFSRIIPLEQSPQEHRLWQLAELFGATCLADTDPSITHVITNTLGTQKVSEIHQLMVGTMHMQCCRFARKRDSYICTLKK